MSISENYCTDSFAANIAGLKYDISTVWSGPRKGVTARQLADRWKISPKLAQRTIEATTQLCIRSANTPSLSRRFKSNYRMLRYPKINVIVFTIQFLRRRSD